MHHLTRTLAVIALVAVGVLAGAFAALAQSTQSAQRSIGGPRSTVLAPTPPPLPFGDQSHLLSSGHSSAVPGSNNDALSALAHLPAGARGAARLVPYTGPRPPIPKLTDLLKHRARHTQSASGGSIVLTGTSATPFLDDQTLAYGADVFWLCQNLKPATSYRYVVFPPDGTAYVLNARDYNSASAPPNPAAYVATFTTDAQGRCLHPWTRGGGQNGQQTPWYGELPLTTPIAGAPQTGAAAGPTRAAGSDIPYSGVWTIAVQNVGTSQFEAMAYSVVIGTLNFGTFSDPGFTTKANNFASGANVYVSASGLNPGHFYAFGFVNTAGNNLPCVFAIPGGSQNNNNVSCFVNGATGTVPLNQNINGQWSTPASGANAAGTYAVQLYDATTNDLISTQQLSINPSSVIWSALVPYNGGTLGTNLGDTFATDGIINTAFGSGAIAEQSVTGIQYALSGVTSGHQYQLNVSNGNGVILNSATTDTTPVFGSPQAFATQAPFTAASTSTGNQKVDFPINTANFALTSFGQTQTPFGPNVYTAQLYDMTAGAVVGSKAFNIVSYAGQFQWTNPAGSYVNANPAGAATNVTTTLRNNAGILYGTWNGDAIKAITLTNDSPGGFVSMAMQGVCPGVTCVNTTTDSLGQTWNISVPVANTVQLVPAVAGQSLPVNATIAIPMAIKVAAGNCTAACIIRTSITPLHGINASSTDPTMTNRATNGLIVYGNGVVGTNASPTYSWAVGAYSGALIVPATPRYPQMMYRSGTNGATTGTYTLTITVNNSGGLGSMRNIEFVMPATVDPNKQTPVLTSAVIAGVNKTTHWKVYTQNGGNGASSDGNLPENAFSLDAADNTAGTELAKGSTATFTITMPLLLASFPFQEIAATANFSDPVGLGGSAAYAIGPNNVLTNAVAGTTNIDSTELAVFSLDTSLMSMTLTPQVIASLPGQSTVLKFINTSTGLDENPEPVSQLIFTVPTNPVPSSVTVTSPNQSGVTWFANAVTGSPGKYHIELCQPDTGVAAGSAPCTGTTDANALPPGAELDITLNWAAAPATGQFSIPWTVTGANGNAQANATAGQQPLLTVANTTAQVDFSFAGGYGGPPGPGAPPGLTPVGTGTQATVGSWTDFNNGNGFVYHLHNNGSTNITDVAIAIPAAATGSGQINDATDWTVQSASIFVYGAGASGAKCSGNGFLSLVQPLRSGPTPGLLRLSGCNVAIGQDLDVFFYALSPYDVGSTFTFPANVATGGATPAVPTTSTMNTTTLPSNPLSDTVRIVTNARLVLEVPSGGTITPLYGGGSPTVFCPGCTFTSGTNLINMNNITGSLNITDVLAASVYTDDSAGWSLSVSSDINPSLASKLGNVTTWVQPTPHSSTRGGFAIAVSGQGAAQPVPTTLASPLLLSTFSGAISHQPIDNLMGFGVTLDPLNVPNGSTTTVTLTYTLIAN